MDAQTTEETLLGQMETQPQVPVLMPPGTAIWTGCPLTVTGGFFKIFGRNLPLSVKI